MVKVPPWQCPGSAPAPRQGAPGGSGRLEARGTRDRATRRPATASGARASRLQQPAAHFTAHLTTQAPLSRTSLRVSSRSPLQPPRRPAQRWPRSGQARLCAVGRGHPSA